MFRTSLLLVCFAALAFGSVIPPEQNNQTEEINTPVLDWSNIKQNLFFQQHSNTFNRLLIRLSLPTVFPFLTNFTANNSSTKLITEIKPISTRESRPLDYQLFGDNNQEIYFLSSFKRPTNVTLNFHLDVTLFGERFQKTVTVANQISGISYVVSTVFSFDVRNASFDQVLASEFSLLRYFRNSLWGRQILFLTTENHHLDIISFKSIANNSFRFEIGSSESPSTRLQSLLLFKRQNEENCDSVFTPELAWFKQDTSLDLDLCSLTIEETNFDYSPDEDYTVDADYSVGIYDSAYSIREQIILFVCIIVSIFLLGILLFLMYKSVHNYVTGLSKKVGHK